MKGEITLMIIKPGAVSKGLTGSILQQITDAGFRISALKMFQMTRREAERFYEVHRGRPFYEPLVEFMISGPIVAGILEKENAIEAYRELIGSTDPSEAEKGSIRNLYGESVRKNAVHGSDSDENAIKEASFFFSQSERF